MLFKLSIIFFLLATFEEAKSAEHLETNCDVCPRPVIRQSLFVSEISDNHPLIKERLKRKEWDELETKIIYMKKLINLFKEFEKLTHETKPFGYEDSDEDENGEPTNRILNGLLNDSENEDVSVNNSRRMKRDRPNEYIRGYFIRNGSPFHPHRVYKRDYLEKTLLLAFPIIENYLYDKLFVRRVIKEKEKDNLYSLYYAIANFNCLTQKLKCWFKDAQQKDYDLSTATFDLFLFQTKRPGDFDDSKTLLEILISKVESKHSSQFYTHCFDNIAECFASVAKVLQSPSV